jgi:hypothetical protein
LVRCRCRRVGARAVSAAPAELTGNLTLRLLSRYAFLQLTRILERDAGATHPPQGTVRKTVTVTESMCAPRFRHPRPRGALLRWRRLGSVLQRARLRASRGCDRSAGAQADAGVGLALEADQSVAMYTELSGPSTELIERLSLGFEPGHDRHSSDRPGRVAPCERQLAQALGPDVARYVASLKSRLPDKVSLRSTGRR